MTASTRAIIRTSNCAELRLLLRVVPNPQRMAGFKPNTPLQTVLIRHVP